jgi:DNA replication protein DnaC
MNLTELERSLRQLRLGGIAAVLETRLRQAQAEPMAPIDLVACLVTDELNRRSERLIERRRKQAAFRDPHNTLDNFDFTFNPKMNRSLVFDLATAAFVARREDALFLGPGGTGKSHLAQAIGQAAIQQGYRVLYRETHVLLDDLAEALAEGTRKEFMETLSTVPLLIIDDFGMRKLPHTAAEDLLEIIMRRYERASTVLTFFLLYPMRRVDCRRCGVVAVEEVPWGDGKRTLTKAYMLFLARWARRLSWKETAECFRTSCDKVFDAVEHVVTWGLEHRTLGQIDAIGVDEIQYAKGYKYLTLVYQINIGITRLLWVGRERTIASFQGFFTTMGQEVISKISFICSDMWEPYSKVIQEKCSEPLHILDRFHIVAKMNKALD